MVFMLVEFLSKLLVRSFFPTVLSCTISQIRDNQTCTKSWLPFRVAFAFLFPVSMGSHTISTESPVRIHCFPPPGIWGQKVTRNGGSQLGACLSLSDQIMPLCL